MPAEPTFGTVLIRRMANKRPPDWELRLRPICSKIRVVERLHGRAHLLVTGNPSVAVRIYNTDDASRLEAVDDEDPDELRNFRDSYEHSIVIFVLPSGQQQRDQLGRRESFVNRAQASLQRRDIPSDENENGKKRRMTRTAIVPDASQVIQTINSLVQALTPEKREKRKKYFAQIASKNYFPSEGSQPTKEAVANHVTKIFNDWAERFEMPNGDSNVILSMLGSLGNVAAANKGTMDEVPIRNDSKELISRFFGGESSTSGDTPIDIDDEKMEAHSNENEFYDNIDDSELLKCPDPSCVDSQTQEPGYHPPISDQYSQTQMTTNHPLEQNRQSFSENIDFTPMLPPHPTSVRQPGYNSSPSIFPESFTQENHFPLRPIHNIGHRGFSSGYRNEMHADRTPAPSGIRQQHVSPVPASQDNIQSFHHANANVSTQGHQNFGYRGHSQSGRYHTKHFM
mmetsp:Transcript_46963/g.98525  ORF Transcript_46963/g.98525 Transcript_46963/m.98525 type:complete len:455 (+) Transcript_46963:83-1447(+)